MPAMPGMTTMTSKVKANKISKNKYEANLNLFMNGTWQLHILITSEDDKKSID